MLPLGLIAGAGLGAAETIYGAIQQNKARKAAAANVMPKYEIPEEEGQSLSLAESMAGQGMSAAARQQLLQNTSNLQGQSIDAILKGGGDANSIANLAGNTQGQLNNTAIYEDKARLQNLSNLQQQRARMSASRDKAWQINSYSPWANRAQSINQQLQGSQNMINQGIGTFGQGVVGGIAGLNKPNNPFRDTSNDQYASAMAPTQNEFFTPSGTSGWNPQEVMVPSYGAGTSNNPLW